MERGDAGPDDGPLRDGAGGGRRAGVVGAASADAGDGEGARDLARHGRPGLGRGLAGHRARLAGRRGRGGSASGRAGWPAGRSSRAPWRARRGPSRPAPGRWPRAMLVFGAHIGFCAPAIPKALAAHVPLSRLARANGVALVGYTLGTAVTVVIAPTRPRAARRRVARGDARRGGGDGGGGGRVDPPSCATARSVGTHAPSARCLRLARNPRLLRVAAMHFLLFGGYLAMLGMLPRDAGRGRHAAGARGLRHRGVAHGGRRSPTTRARGCPIASASGARCSSAGSAVAGLLARGDGGGARPRSTVPLLVVAALGGGCVAPLLFAHAGRAGGGGARARRGGAGPPHARRADGRLSAARRVRGAPPRRAACPRRSACSALVHLLLLVPALGMRDTRAPPPRPPAPSPPEKPCTARTVALLRRARWRSSPQRACSSATPQCHVGADCASGVCDSNGKCVPRRRRPGPATSGHHRRRTAQRRGAGGDAASRRPRRRRAAAAACRTTTAPSPAPRCR